MGHDVALAGLRAYLREPEDFGAAHALHQPCQRASRDIETHAAKLPPDLPDAIGPPVLFKHPKDIGAQRPIPAGRIWQPGRIAPPGQMFIAGGWGNPLHAAARLGPARIPVRIPVRVDETHLSLLMKRYPWR
ncbi:MAG: hypothetical protein U5N10_05625 [Gemmobacter sp.]|nr:hypothetical protein [Gemmobacter sp.]